jgi:hypothetical protein
MTPTYFISVKCDLFLTKILNPPEHFFVKKNWKLLRIKQSAPLAWWYLEKKIYIEYSHDYNCD